MSDPRERSLIERVRSLLRRKRSHDAPRVIVTPNELSPAQILTIRLLIAAALFMLVFLLLWWDRDGLRDQIDGDMSFSDVVYFTMITVTTVGYGDIVPVSTRARLLDALVVTPIRFSLWFLFLGTAYQLIIRQYMEGYRMAKLQSTLNNHLIVCGFGHTGLSTTRELLARGTPAEQILVIDQREDRVQLAGSLGIAAIQADAGHEVVLRDAMIEKAKGVIITVGRDDSTALILLTARHLNPTVRLIVGAKEEENIKLFKQGGADTIVSPATFGGHVLAAAVDYGHIVQYLDDLLTAHGNISLIERAVRPEEVGESPTKLKPDLLLRLYRRHQMVPSSELEHIRQLEAGDILVLLTTSRKSAARHTN